jgi:hypothetical protein
MKKIEKKRNLTSKKMKPSKLLLTLPNARYQTKRLQDPPSPLATLSPRENKRRNSNNDIKKA